MAKAKVSQVVNFHLHLELSPNELDTLRGMMQNPIGYTHSDDEDQTQKEVREAIFAACKQHRT